MKTEHQDAKRCAKMGGVIRQGPLSQVVAGWPASAPCGHIGVMQGTLVD